MKFEIGSVASFPIVNDAENQRTNSEDLIALSKSDWSSYEPEATAIVVTSRISGHGSSHGRVAQASCAAGHGTGSHGT